MGVPELRIIPDESLEPLVMGDLIHCQVEFEGFYEGTRAWRNNNPCNMKYKLPEDFEQWKHEIAQKASDKAEARGIEPKYIVAAMVLESGINVEAIGDSGCSKGVLQYNECSPGHGKAPDTDAQIDMWIDNFSEAYERSGSWEQAVVDWNSPKYAPYWNETIYWKDYSRTLSSITVS